MLTRLPIDSISVTEYPFSGYIFYDVVNRKFIVNGDQNAINAIKRSGATLVSPIFYTNAVTITDPNQYVTNAYVQYQIDVLSQQISNYLPLTGGTMTGPIIVANTDDYPNSMVVKGQVDRLMDSSLFIKVDGGTMEESFDLWSSNDSDYAEYDLVPKQLVDDLVQKAVQDFSTQFSAKYLSSSGGTMTGPLYQESSCLPSQDSHAVTFGFVKNYVQNYIKSTDWNCSTSIGAITSCK